MTQQTQEEILAEVHQALLGVPDNPNENGLIGIVGKIDAKLDVLNGRVRGNEVRSKVNQSIIGTLSGGGILGLIGKLLGWF